MKLENCPTSSLKTKFSSVANAAASYSLRSIALRVSALAMLLTLFTAVSMAYDQKVTVAGNPSCATLNASTDPAFAHMSVDWEFKIDPPPSPPGNMYLLTGTTGGKPSNPNMTLGVSMATSTTMDFWQLTWASMHDVNMMVSAVIVKGGPVGANVYTYPFLAYTDSGTFTVPTPQNAISHLSFCFEPFSAVLASYVEVAGRVVDASGKPIPRALVTIQSVNGDTQSVIAGPRGEFLFEEVEAGVSYSITASKANYKFGPKFNSFTDNDSGVVLVGTHVPPGLAKQPVASGKLKQDIAPVRSKGLF